jgi:hypothetical protein
MLAVEATEAAQSVGLHTQCTDLTGDINGLPEIVFGPAVITRENADPPKTIEFLGLPKAVAQLAADTQSQLVALLDLGIPTGE